MTSKPIAPDERVSVVTFPSLNGLRKGVGAARGGNLNSMDMCLVDMIWRGRIGTSGRLGKDEEWCRGPPEAFTSRVLPV